MKKLAIYSMFALVVTICFSCAKQDSCRKKCKSCGSLEATTKIEQVG